MPRALFVLMVLAVAVTLGIVGVATEPSAACGVHAAIVAATGAGLAATLTLVRDLDQPYAGALQRSPSQTEFIRAQITPEVRGPLPCDDGGSRPRASGFMLGALEEYFTINGVNWGPGRQATGAIMNNPANPPVARNYDTNRQAAGALRGAIYSTVPRTSSC